MKRVLPARVSLRTELFDYELPESAIAQVPADRRDASKLLVVDRTTGSVQDRLFSELPELLPEPMRIFRNSAAVLPARLFGERPSGGKVECLLLRPSEAENEWWCLIRPGKRFRNGGSFGTPDAWNAEVIGKQESGEFLVRFNTADGADVTELARRYGRMPLPPYIRREDADERARLDLERYQTVYAENRRMVAAAAPTAGLHFTPELIRCMEQSGSTFHNLVLHVGLGTFRPIQTDTVDAHEIHHEVYELPGETLSALEENAGNDAQKRKRLCVGTTSLRAIEDFYRKTSAAERAQLHDDGYVGDANIYIWPPSTFHVDALITNFHLPRSTLMCLVSAFLTPGHTDGIRWLKDIYKQALAWNYRFYSYGDAMLIL